MTSGSVTKEQRSYDGRAELMFLAGAPVVYHCHHFNLFLDQTIDDALGSREGLRLRTSAAHEFFYELLEQLSLRLGAETPAERIQLAQQAFREMGQGLMEFSLQADGGQAIGRTLHYAFAWKEKYGAVVKRRLPADAVASGFAAAVAEHAFNLPSGTMQAVEKFCIATKAEHCEFELSRAMRREKFGPPVGSEEHRGAAQEPIRTGLYEDRIATITEGLRGFLGGVAGDSRGLVQAFGVFVTMHLAGYYNRVSYDTLKAVEEKSPDLVPSVETLLRESGHVCVFNTFGGILSSPEWEGMVGKPTGACEEILIGCVAIARALGFGHWYIEAYEDRKRLVLRASSTYEAGFYLTRYGKAQRPMEYFFQGAALAITQLAHRVDWTKTPELSQSFYDSLFKGELPCKAEQTKSLQCGDAYSEVIVSKK